jgi:hypothetical protein
MSRFGNHTAVAGPAKATKTINRAGGEAYDTSAKLKFVSILLTSFLQDQFYRSANATVQEIRALIGQLDPVFVAKAAIYARNEFGMRSVSHLVAAEIARKVKGQPWVKDFLTSVVRRPDDITEILACYLVSYGKPVPNSLKKGLGRAFSKFDYYQIAKYRRENATFSLVDAVNLLHPPHSDPVSALVRGTLEAPETWEKKLTQAGQSASEDVEQAKSASWKELILSGKIGYMALLRNLRNIAQSCGDDPAVIEAACSMLTNGRLISKSLVFPFRFLTALEELGRIPGHASRQFMVAITKAVDLSLGNLPRFPGESLIALDVSASMQGQPSNIGSLFAAAFYKCGFGDLMVFDTDAQ